MAAVTSGVPRRLTRRAMSSIERPFVRIRLVPMSFLVWLTTTGTVWAQGGVTKSSYVVSYVLVVLVIALGLLVVLRPSGRRTEVKAKSDY